MASVAAPRCDLDQRALHNYCCYILESESHSYVGCTNNLARRLRQHNGEICGGARANRGKTSWVAAVVDGFPDKRSALQFEWAIKHTASNAGCRRLKGAARRVYKVASMVAANKACRRCSSAAAAAVLHSDVCTRVQQPQPLQSAAACQHTWDWTRIRMRIIARHASTGASFQRDPRIRVVGDTI